MANLKLDDNSIEELPVRALELTPNLIELHLERNRLKVINDQAFHASSTKRLEWLNLAHNALEEIGSRAFDTLAYLLHLNLAGNHLTHLNPQTFNALSNLEHLSLEYNRLFVLHDRALNQLPRLKHLTLAHNRLSHINASTFHELPKLEKLSLAHNEFREFSLQSLDQNSGQLSAIDLSHNKLSKYALAKAK